MKGLCTDLSLALVSFPDVRAKEFQSSGSIENFSLMQMYIITKIKLRSVLAKIGIKITSGLCPYPLLVHIMERGVSVLISLDYTLVILQRILMFKNFFPCGSLYILEIT